MKTLGITANVYNEINALPGWLEMACNSGLFDDVQVYHAGPHGMDSTDGTIELLEKWRVPIHRGKIDEGFGMVRTAAVHACKTDYVMLLDADERFWAFAPVVTCVGESTPPEEESRILAEYDKHARLPPSESGTGDMQWQSFEEVRKLGEHLTCSMGEIYNQGAWVKDMIQHGALDAVCTIRRHWHAFGWQKPTQNWHHRPDYQLRLVRNHESIFWDANKKMHEQLIGAPNRHMPNQIHGPFFDHYHMHFKAMEQAQRAHDVRIYDAIHYGHEVPRT
jgi:hypothetical protein